MIGNFELVSEKYQVIGIHSYTSGLYVQKQITDLHSY
jgi:hypothetical protein